MNRVTPAGIQFKADWLEVDEFVAALNKDERAALAALHRWSKEQETMVLPKIAAWVALMAASSGGFFWSTRFFNQQAGILILIPVLFAVASVLFLLAAYFWKNPEAWADWLATPLYDTSYCLEFERLVNGYPHLPLVPPAGVTRQIYAADYQRALHLVSTEANKPVSRASQADAGVELHSRAGDQT